MSQRFTAFVPNVLNLPHSEIKLAWFALSQLFQSAERTVSCLHLTGKASQEITCGNRSVNCYSLVQMDQLAHFLVIGTKSNNQEPKNYLRVWIEADM